MGDVSRRAVLSAGVGAAGLMALGLGEQDAAATSVRVTVPRRSDYQRALGRIFTAKTAGHTYRLRLTRIHDFSHTAARLRPEAYTLVFARVGGAALPDAIYVLHSNTIAPHKLFLSSIGTNRGLQAVVNRTV